MNRVTARLLIACWIGAGTATLPDVDAADAPSSFGQAAAPLLNAYCVGCHNADDPESGIRLDNLTGEVPDSRIRLWEGIQSQLQQKAMPPEEAEQPADEQRRRMLAWIGQGLRRAKSRQRPRNGAVRRLTVSQYRNTLRDLLGIAADFTDILPPDAVSKDGFRNNQETLLLSPRLLESYFQIAGQALDRCIVDPDSPPTIQSFRMELGEGVNDSPYPDKLILGANSHLLENDDFVVTELQPAKPFDYVPFQMRRKFRFIEGYQGNATVRGWRDFDSIYHAVFACMRGTRGYPKGEAFEVVPDGLLLRPAIPSPELFGQSSTYGPQANFKISLRELPDRGNFRVRVRAAKYDDALLLDDDAQPLEEASPDAQRIVVAAPTANVAVPETGVYRLDVHFKAAPKQDKSKPQDQPAASPWGKRVVEQGKISLELGGRRFSGTLQRRHPRPTDEGERVFRDAFLIVRLDAGPLQVRAAAGADSLLQQLVLQRLPKDDPQTIAFRKFESRTPLLGVHLGLRRDCGSTLTRVGEVQPVNQRGGDPPRTYVVSGAIENFPRPFGDADNPNYLAGVREIGVRSEYTDGRDMPRLLIQAVEFEGPYYDNWPPRSHRSIFLDRTSGSSDEQHARKILRNFAARAYRRPATAEELAELMDVFQDQFAASEGSPADFRASVRDALLVALTSPQFLFLIENSATPEPEDLDDYELASKLSYFLWNTAPDQRLLDLAAKGQLEAALPEEVDRLVDDPRFADFAEAFVEQWMALEKFDVVEIDRQRYPQLTRDTRTALRQEPVRFVEHLFRANLPIRNLIASDFIVANEVVADYYGLGEASQSGFRFAPLRHQRPALGGLLTQASILSGLSDGREGNPVKRGAWFARKIIAKPPADPPPNVPALDEQQDESLTLREKLQRHRDQDGCRKCHEGIDPWGVPFEQFDAAGRFKDAAVDASSTLPDGKRVENFDGLRRYLLQQQQPQVVFSVLKHLATYGAGRTLNYNEIEFLRQKGIEWGGQDRRMRELLHFLVQSDIFRKK